MRTNMKNRIGWMLAAAGVVGMAAGCSPAAKNKVAQEKTLVPVAVRTAAVARRDLSESLQFTGELESPLAVAVNPKAQGRLAKLELKDGSPVTEGVEVRKDEVIAEIDHRDLEAHVALAAAQLQQAEVAAADRERERRRIAALFAEQVATEQARDAAATAHESALAAQAQAQAQLQLARVNLEEAFIHAPMDGVIAKRQVDPGAMVGPGVSIVQVAQMDPLRLMLALPAHLLPVLAAGKTQVAVATDVHPGREFTCTLQRIFPTVDSATRTVRAEVRLDNPKENGDWLLRPGMYATARLVLETSRRALTVPAAAVIRVLDRKLVFVVRGNIARAVTVQTGIRDGADTEITDGLAEGNEVVVLGQNKLTDGAPIERVAAAPAGAE
jgi:membrane fusion protein, multidrug efflux system